jgi:hypothetical protein
VDLEGEVTFPTIHLNGTSKERLAEGYEKAYSALQEAERIVHRETVPNARDYYPQGNEAFSKAMVEHESRMKRLKAVREEIYALFEAVEAQS